MLEYLALFFRLSYRNGIFNLIIFFKNNNCVCCRLKSNLSLLDYVPDFANNSAAKYADNLMDFFYLNGSELQKKRRKAPLLTVFSRWRKTYKRWEVEN